MLVQQIALFVFAFSAIVIEADPNAHSAHIFKHVQTKTPPEVQQQAATELIGRVLPERAHEFKVFVDNGLKLNTFKVDAKVKISRRW